MVNHTSKVIFFSPSWRSPTTFEKGHVNSPSQNGHRAKVISWEFQGTFPEANVPRKYGLNEGLGDDVGS